MSFKSIENKFASVFGEQVSRKGVTFGTQKMGGMVVNRYSESSGDTLMMSKSFQSTSTQLILPNQYQRLLRPIYGKDGVNPPSIGDHPDFEHLLGTDFEQHCSVTTLFMDMEGSTRLNLLYPSSDVARIKNAFIQMAIEVVKSFDGHVHRIMGDAVMAYFGGPAVRQEDAAVNAINCAAVLQLLVRKVVVPFLEREGFGTEFGIRIGLDYGPNENVLWRSYGFPDMEEVTATSFYVDVASKLQHAAGRHQVMLGNSLQTFLDFPTELLEVKQVTQNGQLVDVPYLLPNLTGSDGKPINYRQYVLKWDSYLACSPLSDAASTSAPIGPLRVSATMHPKENGTESVPFIAGSTVGIKGHWLCFKIEKLPYLPQLPYLIRCAVTNHGSEAQKDGKDYSNHETDYKVLTAADHKDILHWEKLAYRGLHYLDVEVKKQSGAVINKRRFGVYIE